MRGVRIFSQKVTTKKALCNGMTGIVEPFLAIQRLNRNML